MFGSSYRYVEIGEFTVGGREQGLSSVTKIGCNCTLTDSAGSLASAGNYGTFGALTRDIGEYLDHIVRV